MSHQANDPVALFGLPIANFSAAQAATSLDHVVRSGGRAHLVVVDASTIHQALRNASLQRGLCECATILADATVVRLAARVFGVSSLTRVRGVDLVRALAAIAAESGHRIYLLGGNHEVASVVARVLKRNSPGLSVAGVAVFPPGCGGAFDSEDLLHDLDGVRPALLLADVSWPEQQVWLQRHRDLMQVPAVVSVSGVFEAMALAEVPIPAALIRLRLGPVLRAARRLRRRSLRRAGDAAVLTFRLLVSFLADRLQPQAYGGALAPEIVKLLEVRRGVRVVATPAVLGGSDVCASLRQETRRAIACGQTLILDASDTIRISPDGLGALLEARRLLLEQGLWIWLTAVSKPVARLLQVSGLTDLFRVALDVDEAIHLSASSPVRLSGGSGRLAAPASNNVLSPACAATLIATAS